MGDDVLRKGLILIVVVFLAWLVVRNRRKR